MGSLGLTSPRLGAFQSDTFPRGLDLGRSVILQDVGVFKAAAAADFEQGMLVAQDANGEVVKCDSRPVFGVAKWNKTNTLTGAVIDEAVVFATSGGTTTLTHPNVSNLQVRSAVDFGGSAFASPGDFTLNAVNGVLTHAGGGSTIPVGTSVFVTYTFQLSSDDLDFQGRNFFNFTDDVSVAAGRVTVITDASVLFTSQYDTSRVFTLTGTAKNLHCGGTTAGLEGLFTNDPAEGEFVGHVIQIPTADDPFLGVRLGGDPIIQP